MKNRILNILFVGMAFVVMLFASCQPDKYELGDLLSVENLKYSIVQDTKDPNTIILTAENKGYTPYWITPMGRSNKTQDTLRIPFEGDYNFIYGIITPGGIVQADTFVLNLTTNNTDYVDDILWTYLSGGVGEEKEWYLDLDEDGQSKFFKGPLYFYGTDDSWETVTMGNEDVEGDVWNWEADWPGNTWIMPEGDYGSIIFSLKGNASVTVNHNMLGRVENGTYFLDENRKTLKMTDASPLHDEGRDGQVIDWGDIVILSLTENSMQLAVLRDEVLSGEGPTLLSYNFVSKDYYDNWVPEDVPEVDPEPELPDDWELSISQVISKTIVWTLSDKNPLDWANLDGSRMNGFNVPEDYPEWLGTPDPSVYAGFSLKMNSETKEIVYTAPDGTEEEGTYTLDEKGIYTFTGINPSFSVIGWASFSLTAENQLRILSIEKNTVGDVIGMWLGAKDPEKPEYFAYHLVPSAGAGGQSDVASIVKNMLTSKVWKLDSERSYDVETSFGAEQGPVIFSDYDTWAYNPMPGEQYGAGEAEVDYGTMKFEKDGTVKVNQRKKIHSYINDDDETVIRNGIPEAGDELVSNDIVELNGTWEYNDDDKSLVLSVGMLHPWTADYAVADWGDTKIYKIENDALLLQVMRSEELSGEEAMPMTYVFVPAE
ncbi:MAG: hypothetical protein GX963_07335 [Bacteroidales bacterium]|nr:hypothetical protein [Bacteroidales bacterium]